MEIYIVKPDEKRLVLIVGYPRERFICHLFIVFELFFLAENTLKVKEKRKIMSAILSGIPAFKWVMNLGASPQTPGMYGFGPSPGRY
jgi:hypothetical protein